LPIEINTYLPTADVNVVKKVKNFHQLVETTDINLRQKDEQIDAGEAMWLMEATGNYLYNRNAKYKHGNENLSLDFELSFKLQQGVSKQATVSKNEVLKEVEVLHRTIDSRSSSMSRLPRLVDYEIASIKEGMVNFKVRVVLVNEELRESYDANREYGLKEQRVPGCANGVTKLSKSCANVFLGYGQRPFEYIEECVDCLRENYGQYWVSNISLVRSHIPNSSIGYIDCYDDGTYDEYAMKGELFHGEHTYDVYIPYGEKAINFWNNDICSFVKPYTPPNMIVGKYVVDDFLFENGDEGSQSYWCVQGVYIGRAALYSYD